MTWSTDEKKHLAMVSKIQEVCSVEDKQARWYTALSYIAEAVAYYSEPGERVGSYTSVLALAALHPNDMKAVAAVNKA